MFASRCLDGILPRHVASLALVVTVIMSAYVAPVQVMALEPTACNCVIFRLDDIQDYWLAPVQTSIIDQFIARNEPLSLGIVMNFVGNDPAIVNKVKQGAGTGILELTLHGWNHVDYQGLTKQQQYDTLQLANTKMQTLWGRGSKIFIPPYNSYNNNTLAATSQLGLKIISSEFDQEIESVLPHRNNPNHIDNKIYKAFQGSNIMDQFGVYHLPQEVGFYNYEFEPPIKNSVSGIKTSIDTAITNYGYAVVTLHPQDFTVKNPDGSWTNQLDQNEINDLNTLITDIQNKGYHIKTFSDVANIPLPPLVDNIPPTITAPADKAVVSSTALTQISNLGSPTVSDNIDTSPTVTNDAPSQGFPQGTTVVTWTAADDYGNTAFAKQYVTVATSADTARPNISVTTPLGPTVNGPAAGVNILIRGTASDAKSGLKFVEVRTDNAAYKLAKQDNPGSWSNWSYVLTVKKSGTITVVARATDFFDNQQWWTSNPVTVNLSGPDSVAPVITPPANIVMEATGPKTVVALGTPSVFDNSDLSPHISFNAPGAGESEIGFAVGTTNVNWTATDASGNSAMATQHVTIVDSTPPTIPALLSPVNGSATSNNQAQLFWSDAADLVSGVTYDLVVANSPDFAPSAIVIDQEGLVASTYTPEVALPDGTYYWKVRALDAQENESLYSPVWTFTVDTAAPATVTASPAGGTYAAAQNVTLSASEPATIYYTTDGSIPTTSSATYSSSISLTANTVLKFFAVDGIGNSSPVQTETYILATSSASPAGGTYNAPQSVTITSSVPGAIYYTTDGTMPTTGSILYSSPIAITADTVLRFFATDSLGNAGATVSETYTFDTVAPTVSALPAGGTYSLAQLVNLTASEPAVIYYTVDGTAPSTNSSVYTGSAISVSADTVLRFFAIDSTNNVGAEATASYIIDTAPPVVTAQPPAGLYNGPVGVILSASEPATIYYTTDGSTPTASASVYSAPIEISADAVLKFFGVDTVGNAGAIESSTYLFDVQAPSVSAQPAGGTYGLPQSVTLVASESATTIYYTVDGSEPSEGSAVYSGPIEVGGNTTLKFFAKDLAGNAGAVQTETYTMIDTQPPAVTATPPGGSYTVAQNVALSASEPATIYYTTDNSEPTTSSATYSTSIPVSATTTLKFFGVDGAGNAGSVQTQTYTFGSDTIPPTVTAAPPGGTYGTAKSVELSADESSAAIYFTTDGSEPSTNSTVYSGPILLPVNTTLKFFAVDLAGNTGATATEVYTIDTAGPTVTANPPQGKYALAQIVALTASEEPATIYYTTDGNNPTTNSTVYSAPIHINVNTTLKFFATDSFGNAGGTVSQAYTFDTVAPTVTAAPPAGTYAAAQNVTLSASEPATIYYTKDGSTPTTNSSAYSGSPVLISANTVLKFFAVDAVGNTGAVRNQTYAIDFQPPTVSASPAGGTYASTQSVSLTANEPATIYYTIDGSAPTTSSNVYSAALQIASTTTLKFFAVDAVGNVGSASTEVYTINTVSFPITHMSDTTASFGVVTNSGTPSHVEFVSPTSQLVGKSIDQITVKLRKTGTPTGNIEVGVFNSDLSVKKLFGTRDAATVASAYSDYVFALPNSELYIVQAGDRIGIKFTGGNSNNLIAIMTDQDASDPFDGANSYRQQYTTLWASSTTTDLYMTLKQTHGATDTTPPTITALPAGGTYTSTQFVELSSNEPATTIYYTTDGTTPTTSSPVYSSPITVAASATLKFFGKDAAGNIGSVRTESYTLTLISYPVTHMSDTTASFGLATNSAQQSHVEFVSSGSQLVGKSIDQITVKLRRTGAPTGTIEVGIFNSDLTVKKLFGSKDAGTVATVYTDYTFSLTNSELYTIQAGDRIGIKFTGGNSNNLIAIMTDQDASDPFDGANTYYQYYTSSWLSATTKDLYMVLNQTHG